LRVLLRLATRRDHRADLAGDRHGRQRHQAGSRTLEDEDGKTAANVAAVEGGSPSAPTAKSTIFLNELAEGEGFEPPEPFPVQWFSRPPPSTTRPSLRTVILFGKSRMPVYLAIVS